MKAFLSAVATLLVLVLASPARCQEKKDDVDFEKFRQYFELAKARVCIKSYPWPWEDLYTGEDFEQKFQEHLQRLDAKEMKGIREQVDKFVTRYETNNPPLPPRSSLSHWQKALVDRLKIGLDKTQVRLYGDFFYILVLSREEEFEEIAKTVNAIRESRDISAKDVQRTELEKELDATTTLGPNTLRNYIATLDYRARAHLAREPKEVVEVVTAFLDDRPVLKEYFNNQVLPDPTESILNRLGNIAPNKLKALMNVRVEETKEGTAVHLTGKKSHRVIIDEDGEARLARR